MASDIIADNSRTYQAHQRDTLPSEVALTICILLPRAFAVAGFDRQGSLLTIHYNAYPGDHPAWNTAFFEQQLANNPLLAKPQGVRSVFIGTDQQLLVPDALYQPEDADVWLKALCPVGPGDAILRYSGGQKIECVFAFPDTIYKLVQQRLGNAQVLPLVACQLHQERQQPGAALQCLLSDEEVFASLRMNGKLLWQKVFSYTHAADIAWEFAALCKQHYIPLADFHIQASTTNDRLYDDLLELETYFPKLRWQHQQDVPAEWAPAVSSMEALYACVS